MDYILSRQLLRTPASEHQKLVFDKKRPNRFKNQELTVCASSRTVRLLNLDWTDEEKKNGKTIELTSLNQYNNKELCNPGEAAYLLRKNDPEDTDGCRGITKLREAIRYMSQTQSQIYCNFVDRQSMLKKTRESQHKLELEQLERTRLGLDYKVIDFSDTAVAKRAMEWVCAAPFPSLHYNPLRNMYLNLKEKKEGEEIITRLKKEVRKKREQKHSSKPYSSQLARKTQAFLDSLTEAREKTLEKMVKKIEKLVRLAEREHKKLQSSTTPKSSRPVEQNQKAQESIAGPSPRKKKTMQEKLAAIDKLEKELEERKEKELQSSTSKLCRSAKQTEREPLLNKTNTHCLRMSQRVDSKAVDH